MDVKSSDLNKAYVEIYKEVHNQKEELSGRNRVEAAE